MKLRRRPPADSGGPLPHDLDALGAALERAAQRELRRRHLLRRLLQGGAVVAVAVPLAVAVSSTELAPSTPLPQAGPAAKFDATSARPSWAFAVGHIPDELLPPVGPLPCLDGLDCGLHRLSVTFTSPTPEDKP